MTTQVPARRTQAIPIGFTYADTANCPANLLANLRRHHGPLPASYCKLLVLQGPEAREIQQAARDRDQAHRLLYPSKYRPAFASDKGGRPIVAIWGCDMLRADESRVTVLVFDSYGMGANTRSHRFNGLLEAEQWLDKWARRKFRYFAAPNE